VRVAIVGVGAIAELGHIPALESMGDAELVGFVDPDEARRGTLHERWPRVPAHATLSDLENSGLPDAVVVATPPEHHLEPALWARRRDLHLYLEKPVAASGSDVHRLVEAWQGATTVAMMGLNYRFHPAVIEFRDRIAAGEIGQLVAIQTIFATPGVPPNEWRASAKSGGGVLLDLGTHHLDLLSYLTGARIDDIACTLLSRRSERDTAFISATLSSGCVAQCSLAFGAAETDRIDVFGEEGALTLDRLRGSLAARPDRFGYTTRAALGRATAAIASAVGDLTRARGEPSYRSALSAWLEKIAGGRQVLPTLEEGAHLHELVETATEASKRGERVALVTEEIGGV